MPKTWTENEVSWFWSRVTNVGNYAVCWAWLGHKDKHGRGHFRIGGGKQSAHHIVWQLYHSPIPEGMMICHRCDNSGCLNPDHMFLGTAWDNTHDMIQKGRDRFSGGKSINERLAERRNEWEGVLP